MNVIEPATLTLAYILDLAIGDPKQLPHPVRIMGWAITKVEGFLRRRAQMSEHRAQNTEHRIKNKEGREKCAGVLLVMIVVGFIYGLFYVINSVLLTFPFSPLTYYLSLLFLVYLISTTFATHELIKSAQLVIEALKANNIEGAKKNLSCIVGRDTKPLDRNNILKATIETLAENTSDGIIAPLFYLSIGGLPLAMSYKAINTLDSMLGYKNEKYKNFGWAAARLDDIANYIPARITGFLIVISTFIIGALRQFKYVVQSSSKSSNGLSGLNSFRIMLRDGKNHLSPNSGIPEAAMAGALGIRLGGPLFYEGVIVEKPYIGEERQSTEHRTKSPVGTSSLYGTQITDVFYLMASQGSITITKIASLLGFSGVLALSYVRTAL